MRRSNQLLLTLIATAALGTQAFASDQQQTLELDSADVEVLQLVSVENEARNNADELHQESTVGRAGLAGLCELELRPGDSN